MPLSSMCLDCLWVTSTTFRKLESLRDKLLTQLAEDVGLHARSPHSPQLPQDKPQQIAAKVKELLKKLIDNGVGHMKQSDAQQLEAIEFRNYIESDDSDKRSKTVLDDVLSCLQSAIDLCLIAADEFGKQGDQEYMDQLGGVAWKIRNPNWELCHVLHSLCSVQCSKPNLCVSHGTPWCFVCHCTDLSQLCHNRLQTFYV